MAAAYKSLGFSALRSFEYGQERAVATSRQNVTLLPRSAEIMPLDDRSVDTIVVTWSLCSIVHLGGALRESRRVLRPGGQLRFVEHGLSPDPNVCKWQDRLTPLWRRCAGGCHLNRKMDDLIRGAGFQLTELSTGYARGPKPMAFMYEGCAI
jgi:SAM-dependent methyltransferase